MDYPPAVGVGHHVAHGDAPVQELTKGQVPRPHVVPRGGLARVEVLDGFLEALPLDQPHGVERLAPDVPAQAVDWNYARMFKPAGDLGFEQETGATAGIIGAFG